MATTIIDEIRTFEDLEVGHLYKIVGDKRKKPHGPRTHIRVLVNLENDYHYKKLPVDSFLLVLAKKVSGSVFDARAKCLAPDGTIVYVHKDWFPMLEHINTKITAMVKK